MTTGRRHHGLTRRNFLRRATLGAAALASLPILQACSQSASQSAPAPTAATKPAATEAPPAAAKPAATSAAAPAAPPAVTAAPPTAAARPTTAPAAQAAPTVQTQPASTVDMDAAKKEGK